VAEPLKEFERCVTDLREKSVHGAGNENPGLLGFIRRD
jgi:hypothetical protein